MIVLPQAQGYEPLMNSWEVMVILAIVPISVLIYGGVQAYQMQKLLQHTIYGVTDRRAILLTVTATNMRVASYGPSDLANMRRIERPDGYGDILFGQAQLQRTGLALRTVIPGFVGVAEVRRVEQFIVQLRQHSQDALSGYK